MLRSISWLKAITALAIASGSIAACLLLAGRRFAARIAFDEINSMATLHQKQDDELVAGFAKQLANTTDPLQREDLQSAIDETKRRSPGFICLDQATGALFSAEQRAVLEESLKRYYSKVIWGENHIPQNLTDSHGELKNGFVMGYSFTVYPGVVKLETHAQSGLLGGGGHTDIYIWKGLGFRFEKRIKEWVS